MNLILMVLSIMLFASLIEKKTTIPSLLTIIALAIATYAIMPTTQLFQDWQFFHNNFDLIVAILLPLVLLPDILEIHFHELKQYWKEIFFLAFLAVVTQAFFAFLLLSACMFTYHVEIGLFVCLSAVLVVTDAVTVTSILKKFKIPHKLKFLIEAESLFNDVTGMLLFFIIGMPLVLGQTSIVDMSMHGAIMILGSAIVGLLIGYIGYKVMVHSDDIVDELVIILIAAYASYFTAENFHLSGIFTLVITLIVFQLFLTRELDLGIVKRTTKKKLKHNLKTARMLGTFANAVIFIALASIFDINKMILYLDIIFIISLTLLVLRAAHMNMFVNLFLSEMPQSEKISWITILTFGGIRGALGILMIHMLPESEYKAVIETIASGVILFSIVFYTPLLLSVKSFFVFADDEEQHIK